MPCTLARVLPLGRISNSTYRCVPPLPVPITLLQAMPSTRPLGQLAPSQRETPRRHPRPTAEHTELRNGTSRCLCAWQTLQPRHSTRIPKYPGSARDGCALEKTSNPQPCTLPQELKALHAAGAFGNATLSGVVREVAPSKNAKVPETQTLNQRGGF